MHVTERIGSRELREQKSTKRKQNAESRITERNVNSINLH